MRRPAVPLVLVIASLPVAGCARVAQQARVSVAAVARPVVAERCTDTWISTRPNGRWDDPRNWSEHREPAGDDQACIPRSRTVTLVQGRHEVGSLIDGGGLTIAGGSLGLMDASTASEVADFRLERGGSYFGPGDLIITHSMNVTGGAMRGGSGLLRRSPSAVTCGPHNPPLLAACMRPDPGAEQQVRDTWRHLVELLRAGGPFRDIAAVLTPRACLIQGHAIPHTARGRAAACHRTISRILAIPSQARFSPDLTNLIVDGDHAYADGGGAGNVRLVRRHGTWRVFQFAGFGWP